MTLVINNNAVDDLCQLHQQPHQQLEAFDSSSARIHIVLSPAGGSVLACTNPSPPAKLDTARPAPRPSISGHTTAITHRFNACSHGRSHSHADPCSASDAGRALWLRGSGLLHASCQSCPQAPLSGLHHRLMFGTKHHPPGDETRQTHAPRERYKREESPSFDWAFPSFFSPFRPREETTFAHRSTSSPLTRSTSPLRHSHICPAWPSPWINRSRPSSTSRPSRPSAPTTPARTHSRTT